MPPLTAAATPDECAAWLTENLPAGCGLCVVGAVGVTGARQVRGGWVRDRRDVAVSSVHTLL